MCGLVGLGDFRPRAAGYEHDIFTQMLIADSVRGTHGTGVVKVYTNGTHDWRKMEGDPYTMFRAAGVNAFMSNYDKKDIRFLLGHNRSATYGDKDTKNAHPFEIGSITLMHNGTLEKHSPLLDFNKFAVDSQAICNSIDKIGIEKTMPNIRGAYALVYYDSKAKKLNLIRNKDRPLYLGVHEKMGRVYFASEFGMLRWILSRNNITAEDAKIEMIPEHQLISFEIMKKDQNGFIPTVRDMTEFVYTYKDKVYEPWKPSKFGHWDPKTQTYIYEPIEDETDVEAKFFPKEVASSPHTGMTKREKFRSMRKAKEVETRGLLTLVPNKIGKGVGDFLRPKGTLHQVDELFQFHRGDKIEIIVADYKENNKDEETYAVEGFSLEHTSLTIMMFIKGNKMLDAMMNAPSVVATIRSIQFNPDYDKDKECHHRMWCTDPEPQKRTIDTGEVCDECMCLNGFHSEACSIGEAIELRSENEETEAELTEALREEMDVLSHLAMNSQSIN